MTVAELIEQLKLHKPDMRVIVRGYEDGYNDVSSLIPEPIKLNKYTEWYYGSHGSVFDDEVADEVALHISV